MKKGWKGFDGGFCACHTMELSVKEFTGADGEFSRGPALSARARAPRALSARKQAPHILNSLTAIAIIPPAINSDAA
jgi:hypothetical protein